MPINRFKLRNFDNHHDSGYIPPLTSSKDGEISVSNSLHDRNNAKTHYFLHTNRGKDDDFVRIISDVEICLSNAQCVTSQFPEGYRHNLMNSLRSQDFSLPPQGLTDEQLEKTLMPSGMELGERAAFARESVRTIGEVVKNASSSE